MDFPIIVGIDPGTTCAWAILDTNGSVLEVGSSKEVDLGELLEKVRVKGIPMIVGSDKENTPGFVKQFCSKTGSKLVLLSSDMSVEEKRRLARIYNTNNTHERDALASAVFAHKKHHNLFRKIKKICEIRNKKELENKIFFLVITKSISIDMALKVVDEAERDIEHVKKRIERKDDNISKFIEKYSEITQENSILKAEVQNLENKLKHEKREKLKLNEILRKDTFDKKPGESLQIKKLQSRNAKLKKEKEELICELNLISEALEDINDFIVCKRIKKLGKDDFEEINIKPGQVFYVEEPSSFSPVIKDELKKNNAKIISDNPPKTLKNELTIIPRKKLEIRLAKNFAFVTKESFFKNINKRNLIEKLVDEYKNERENEKIWNSP